ncbi:hypothetical protein QVD17_13886 [Tagetes erecta]|uniref:Uncharacterized protein n=1 Tax=Tagetes erecta TaxID=13708 RepID=A0AAD8L2Q6_TARER|nr:hypothetical protein QVD17_13886 [Tagetes erecta]
MTDILQMQEAGQGPRKRKIWNKKGKEEKKMGVFLGSGQESKTKNKEDDEKSSDEEVDDDDDVDDNVGNDGSDDEVEITKHGIMKFF